MYRVYKIGDFLLGSSGNTGAGQQNSPVMSRLTNISKLAYFACLSRRRLRIMQNRFWFFSPLYLKSPKKSFFLQKNTAPKCKMRTKKDISIATLDDDVTVKRRLACETLWQRKKEVLKVLYLSKLLWGRGGKLGGQCARLLLRSSEFESCQHKNHLLIHCNTKNEKEAVVGYFKLTGVLWL